MKIVYTIGSRPLISICTLLFLVKVTNTDGGLDQLIISVNSKTAKMKSVSVLSAAAVCIQTKIVYQ